MTDDEPALTRPDPSILTAGAQVATEYLAGIETAPVWQPTGEPVRAWWAGAGLPERGTGADQLLADVRERVLAYPMGNGHRAFFGWVNAAPEPAALAGAWLAAAANPSSAGGDQASVLVERTAVRWIADLVGFPHEVGAGLLTSGASMATIVMMGAARQRALADVGWDVRQAGLAGGPVLTAYASEEAHSCVRKAVELLGIGARQLRTVPMRGGRLDPEALAEMIAADRAAGLHPFLAVGSAGTVNTGAIDPLDAMAEVCEREKVWFHVDGAYGGFGALDPEVAGAFRGMERADSLALDPHKWLQVPIGTGCLLVADREQLRGTYSLVPAYLRDVSGDALGWYSEYGIEQTRQFRSLPVWATLVARGRAGVTADIVACTSAARLLGRLVADQAELELVAPVELSIVAFRWTRDGVAASDVERVNAALPAAVSARGRVFVTGSVYEGRSIVRACLINPLAGAEQVQLLVDEVLAVAAELAG